MRNLRTTLALTAMLVLSATGTGYGVGVAVVVPDVCFSVAVDHLPTPDAWDQVVDAVDAWTAAQTQLFPERAFVPDSSVDGESAAIAIWGVQPAGSGAAEISDCMEPGAAWTARIGRGLLSRGADRMLEAAPTTPGIDSNVEVQWYPDEARIRTWLEFSGPLGVPNGTCWIDDALSVDEDGVARASAESGLKTSPFAENACGRFFDYLPLGGAGEQALTLLPAQVALADGSALRFKVSVVHVENDAIVLSGEIEVE